MEVLAGFLERGSVFAHVGYVGQFRTASNKLVSNRSDSAAFAISRYDPNSK